MSVSKLRHEIEMMAINNGHQEKRIWATGHKPEEYFKESKGFVSDDLKSVIKEHAAMTAHSDTLCVQLHCIKIASEIVALGGKPETLEVSRFLSPDKKAARYQAHRQTLYSQRSCAEYGEPWPRPEIKVTSAALPRCETVQQTVERIERLELALAARDGKGSAEILYNGEAARLRGDLPSLKGNLRGSSLHLAMKASLLETALQ